MVILNNASMVHRIVGDADHALHLAQRAAEISGKPWPPLLSALINVGRYEEALELGREHVDIVFHSDMVNTCLAVDEKEEALEWARRGTTERPDLYLNWMALACAQAAVGQDNEARSSFNRAKEMIPTLTVATYEKGMRLAWRRWEDIVEGNIAPLQALGLDD